MWSKLSLVLFLLPGFSVRVAIASTTESSQYNLNSQVQETLLELDRRLGQVESILEKQGLSLSKNATLQDVPKSCKEVQEQGQRTSGVYTIKPRYAHTAFPVRCNMETRGGGWTYLLNRYDGSLDFYLDWKNYKNGFGNLSGEFWLGLENIHLLTGYELNELLIELVDWDDKQAVANYHFFIVFGENKGYALQVGDCSGDAGDGLIPENGMKFTTKDRDQDVSRNQNCAVSSEGGWWYGNCKWGHLTGRYLGKNFDRYQAPKGIYWTGFHGNRYSMKQVRMMVRPLTPYTNPLL